MPSFPLWKGCDAQGKTLILSKPVLELTPPVKVLDSLQVSPEQIAPVPRQRIGGRKELPKAKQMSISIIPFHASTLNSLINNVSERYGNLAATVTKTEEDVKLVEMQAFEAIRIAYDRYKGIHAVCEIQQFITVSRRTLEQENANVATWHDTYVYPIYQMLRLVVSNHYKVDLRRACSLYSRTVGLMRYHQRIIWAYNKEYANMALCQ